MFLGSKRYPKEDDFSDKQLGRISKTLQPLRLAMFGGTNNAYTASDQTVYFAEVAQFPTFPKRARQVDEKGFTKTFDIFAQQLAWDP